MNHPIATALLALAALCAPAHADKFYFGEPPKDSNTEDAAFVEGVLLKDDGKVYVIRVVGGEVTVPRTAVRKIESDGLTVARIEAREKDNEAAVATANDVRRQVQAVEASARRAPERRPEPGILSFYVDLTGVLGNPDSGGRQRTGFDPVLHRADFGGLTAIVDGYLQAALEAQDGFDAARFARRTRQAEIVFSGSAAPFRFRTFDVEPSSAAVRSIQADMQGYIQEQAQRAAHQNPAAERMNLPAR